MLIKVCKKALLVLVVVMLLASAAMAAQASSALVGGDRPSGNGDSLTQYINGGIQVIANDIIRNIFRGNHYIRLRVTVIAEEDTTIKIEAQNIYDNLGHEFSRLLTDSDEYDERITYAHGVAIGGQLYQDVNERLIVGGVPTRVLIFYVCDENYRLASSFARVSLSVNGETLIFRDVPGVQ